MRRNHVFHGRSESPCWYGGSGWVGLHVVVRGWVGGWMGGWGVLPPYLHSTEGGINPKQARSSLGNPSSHNRSYMHHRSFLPCWKTASYGENHPYQLAEHRFDSHDSMGR